MNESDVIAAIKKKFGPNEYAILPQVRNGTGFERSARTADAMVMSLWPSRGLELQGMEIKVSRADWLREMKAPEKAESIYSYCDRWWLVVSSPDIVKDGELPSTWGLMVMGKSGLSTKVAAPKLMPKTMDRLMLAAILRKAQEYTTDNATLEKEKQESFDSGVKAGCKSMDYVQDRLKELEKKVYMFEKASGVMIRNEWDGDAIGKAVRLVRNGALANGRDRVHQIAESARKLAKEAENELSLIDSLCAQANAPVSNVPANGVPAINDPVQGL